MDVVKWLADHKSELAIGLIPTLLAVPLIWILARPVAWWQSRQAKKTADAAAAKAQADANRAITTEIAANLTQLAALWGDINKPGSTFQFEPRPVTKDLTAAFRLSAMEPIRWQRTVWEDRAVQTVAALAADELASVQAVYDDLNRFDVLKGSLGRPMETLAHNYRLSDGGMHAWQELQELIARRIAEGNPLDDPE